MTSSFNHRPIVASALNCAALGVGVVSGTSCRHAASHATTTARSPVRPARASGRPSSRLPRAYRLTGLRPGSMPPPPRKTSFARWPTCCSPRPTPTEEIDNRERRTVARLLSGALGRREAPAAGCRSTSLAFDPADLRPRGRHRAAAQAPARCSGGTSRSWSGRSATPTTPSTSRRSGSSSRSSSLCRSRPKTWPTWCARGRRDRRRGQATLRRALCGRR